MCLPKCGPTDTPRRYRVYRPNKSKQELPFTGNDEQHKRQHSPHDTPTEVSSYEAYLPFTGQFSSDDTLDCVAVPTEDSQASLRREKSRIAAKVRRQKENQSLVRLRLALPIHAIKATHIPHVRRPAESCSSVVDDDDDSLHSDRLDRFALCEVPSYRAACSVSRQQQLAAPEFEKAVTIRLAGNSICLYNWLYPEEHSDPSNTTTFCDTARTFGPLVHQPKSVFSQPSLSLWSQSLIALVVDTAENTVVFAPPSYSQLIGLPWNSIIGLQLPELRARQFVAAAAVSTSPSPKLRTVKPLLTQNRSTDSSSSMRCSPDACFPSTSSATCSLSSSSFSEKSEGWPVAFGDRYSHLTTLIPPDSSLGSSTLSNPVDSNTVVSRASSNDYPSVPVICWASYLLSSSSQKPGARCFATSHRQLSSALSDHLGNSRNDSYPAACTLRVFLFNPVITPTTAKRAQESDLYSSPSPIIPVSCLTDSPVDSSVSSHAGLASSPRSYHLWDSLKFVGVQPSFLSALDHTQADLLDHTLLDFVHPDDLESVADALNSLSEAEPVITTLHRLRSKSGAYRWARFVAFLTRRDSAQLLGSRSDLLDSSCCASHSTEEILMMHHHATTCSSSLGTDLSSRKRRCSGDCNSTAGLCDDGESQDTVKNTTCEFWLICCHQFVQLIFARNRWEQPTWTNWATTFVRTLSWT
ncbi:hypothetical protein CRM22_006866 [Opisthorchis felineus]|uniref:PAS fold-3 domain-containing protein n=1 Tax=Opisthorchis felineus TaxID=147828 RepID=A0A4S2LRV1_OPIFE|nr:hypothetical protein CRM22_006866 [Opisthorchis felineus]